MVINMNTLATQPVRALTAPEFQQLADVPPEAQWFANLDSVQTRRAYKNDLRAFMAFTGIVKPGEFRSVTRSHILAWRSELETQKLAGSTIRRKLAALASCHFSPHRGQSVFGT